MNASSRHTQRGIAILGSTGSVGRQTLDVLAEHSERYHVVALAARSWSPLLRAQVAKFAPQIVAIKERPGDLSVPGTEMLCGTSGLAEAATHPDVDIVVVATSGHDAIVPTMRAIEAGKIIALANKETLVCAGELIMPLVQRCNVSLRPVDSEHSAIWQALAGAPKTDIARIIITASGGPFRRASAHEMATVTAAQALEHPTWSMGGKITIDSASMMNKGLEVIEAHWLFDLPYDQIEVLVHPESIIHSLVEFVDGSQIAQLGLPDMRLPIHVALGYPERVPRSAPRLNLAEIGALHFEQPDEARFPALRLAREAGMAGNTFPTVLSASDDVAVAAFLKGSIGFTSIADVVAEVLDHHRPSGNLTVERILAADAWAREAATATITRTNRGETR